MSNELNYYYIGEASLFEDDIKTSTIEEAFSYLKNFDVISLDIETTKGFNGRYDDLSVGKFGKKAVRREGLQPHLSKIVMVQIGTEEKQFVIDYRSIDLGPIKELLIDPKITIVGHNIKFEYLHFLHNEGIRINNVYDTMVAEKVLYNGLKLSNGLKDLNKRYLGVTVDKDTRLEFLTIGDKPFTLRQISYGAEDILYPLLIRKRQFDEIRIRGVANCISLEMKFLECLGDIEYKGMHFNQNKWLKVYENNLIEYNKYKENLDEFVVKNFFSTSFVDKQLDLFSNEFKCNISWGSPKQVVKFFRHLGACPIEKSSSTGEMAYTVNAKVIQSSLNTLNKDQPDYIKDFIKLYLEFKEVEQSCTTFGIDFFKHVNPITKRLHSNYNQIINTGRISSSGPNLQNIPSDNQFRACFDAPKGWKIVNADYSGQEQIILANKSKDKDLIHFYEQDLGDMHSYIASKIFPELTDLSLDSIKENHKDKRQMAKAAGFAINYGGTGFTIANNLGVDVEVGDFVYDSYFKAFPGLNNFFTKIKKEARRNGYILIDPISGRKYWYDKSNQHKADKLAMNYPIQGEAGGITKLATIYMRKWILKNKMENLIFITNLVHDEINLEVREDVAEIAAKQLEIAMTKAGAKWCKIVPLKAEASIVDYWSH